MKIYTNILEHSTKKALEKLDSSTFFKETQAYLAGGTGLALHFGHRISQDLDFFTAKDFEEQQTIQFLQTLGKFNLKKTAWKTIIGTFEEVKFSIFHYNYSQLEPSVKFLQTAKVASPKDIAAMKIATVSQRCTKRDFIDLYFLIQKFSLEEILKFYKLKFKNASADKIHILKSLIYFTDAENEPMPRMLKKIGWPQIKKTLTEEVKKLAR